MSCATEVAARMSFEKGGMLLTNALPASSCHTRIPPARTATAQLGHSRATDRLKGSMTSPSIALPFSKSSAVIVGGMRKALAASARLAKTPSLLADIVGVVLNVKRVVQRRRKDCRKEVSCWVGSKM